MAPLVLEGHNLGLKHKHFNSLVNEAIRNKVAFEIILSQSSVTDIDHLFKIDIASNYRNVNYIINTFKSEDMLYVSRAINKSVWLITDDQYAHLINPQYLEEELFPQMTAKATNKLLLKIRLNLKNEKRVNEFYKYYEKYDVKKAVKWLPYCSRTIVEKSVVKHASFIEPNLFKILCLRYPTVHSKFIVKKRECNYKPYLKSTVYLLNTDTIQYLDTLEKLDGYFWPDFSKRSTAAIMKNCPDRILNNLFDYFDSVNIETVAKYVKAEKTKEVILSIIKNKNLEHWFSYKNINPFIKQMPKEEKFDFVKTIFIDKIQNDEIGFDTELIREDTQRNSLCSENIYQWYRHAPFDVAFPNLIKLLKVESSPDERAAILKVMLMTAGRDIENALKVLQYYYDNHINECYKYKISFLNAFLTVTNVYNYRDVSWKQLNEIFHSAEVYSESNKDVKKCVETVLVYNVIHNQPVPEIITKKIKFNSLKVYESKLNVIDKSKLFSYLYNYIALKIKKQSTDHQETLNELVELISSLMDLLSDWDKKFDDYPILKNKINLLINLKYEKGKNVQLEKLYNRKKSWRRSMFEESPLLSCKEEVFLNALKHDSTILNKHSEQIELIRYNDNIKLWRFLSKIKIYWNQTIAQDWMNSYNNLIKKSIINKAVLRGVCLLLPSHRFLDLINKYVPNTPKIIYSEIDENYLNIVKNLGQIIHHARPQPPPSAILRYALGDYVQYVLPSLNAIFYNINSVESRKYIPQLLSSDISLQKLGIRISLNKLKTNELNSLYLKAWKSSENSSIRAIIFQVAFKLLCQEKIESTIEELWIMLEMFIDNLSDEENASIYKLLGSVDKVPKYIAPKFCMKSYKFLKSLPPKANCHNVIENVAKSTCNVMDSMDPDFVANIILEFIDIWLVRKKITRSNSFYRDTVIDIIAHYMLCVTSEVDQTSRYDRVLNQYLEKVLALINELYMNDNINYNSIVEEHFDTFLSRLFELTRTNLVNKKYINPINVFIRMRTIIETSLPFDKSYYTATFCKLIIAYLRCYEKVKGQLKEPMTDNDLEVEDIQSRHQDMWNHIVPLYAIDTISLLKEDVDKLFPSIRLTFSKCLAEICKLANKDIDEFIFEKELLKDQSCVLAYLLTIDILPHFFYHNKKMDEVRKVLIANSSLEVRIYYFNKFYNLALPPWDN